MVEIRQITPDDWELLREPRLAGLKDTPWAFGSTYERELAFSEEEWRASAEAANWFVAVDGEDAIGVVNGRFYDGKHWLFGMWTHADARGGGVSDQLVDAVVAWAKSEGARKLQLGVADGNDRAIAFYQRKGFKILSADLLPANIEGWKLMRKSLS